MKKRYQIIATGNLMDVRWQVVDIQIQISSLVEWVNNNDNPEALCSSLFKLKQELDKAGCIVNNIYDDVYFEFGEDIWNS